jgi:hypothetical protein
LGRSIDEGFRIIEFHPFALTLTVIIGFTASGCGDAYSQGAENTGSGTLFVFDRLSSGQNADHGVADISISTGAETAAANTTSSAAFPLTVRPGKRYLEDAAGKDLVARISRAGVLDRVA